jgi:hypothetical protein
MSNIRVERDSFEKTMRTKMSPGHFNIVDPLIDEVIGLFDATEKAMK